MSIRVELAAVTTMIGVLMGIAVGRALSGPMWESGTFGVVEIASIAATGFLLIYVLFRARGRYDNTSLARVAAGTAAVAALSAAHWASSHGWLAGAAFAGVGGVSIGYAWRRALAEL